MPRKLNIATVVMFDYAGTGYSIGGLQRWCRDLAFLALENVYNVTVYQKALRPFKKDIADGFSVHGLVCASSYSGPFPKRKRPLARYIATEGIRRLVGRRPSYRIPSDLTVEGIALVPNSATRMTTPRIADHDDEEERQA